jgi:hypothetical protein
VEVVFHPLAELLSSIGKTFYRIRRALSMLCGGHCTICGQLGPPRWILGEIGLFDPRPIDRGNGTLEEPDAHLRPTKDERARESDLTIQSQVVEAELIRVEWQTAVDLYLFNPIRIASQRYERP